MKSVERVICIMLFCIAVLSLFAPTGTTMFMTILLCTLSFCYVLIGIVSLKAFIPSIAIKSLNADSKTSLLFPVSNWRQSLFVLFTCISLSISCMAILFWFCYWPGGHLLSYFSLALMLPVLVLSLILHARKPSSLLKAIRFRSMVASVLLLMTIFISSRSFFEFKYRNNPEYIRVNNERSDIQTYPNH